jgi:hypothetical protein
MRWTLVVVGAILVAVGAVWILQGLGPLKGSFMTGQALWGWMGAVCVLVGLPVLLRGLRGLRAR